MIKLVLGTKGRGKTKYMLESANADGKTCDGIVVYLDKDSEHMFQLDRAIRLINAKEFPIGDLNALLGFVSGLVAGNSDIEKIYFDSFLILGEVDKADVNEAVKKLAILSDKLGVEFIVSVSVDETEISDDLKHNVTLAL